MITRNCNNCQEPYEADPRYIKRGQGLFCSRSCSSSFNATKRFEEQTKPNVFCAFCTEPFYLNPSKQKNSKSGLFFCSREHKDSAQRLGGIEEIMPNHYGTSNIPSYRKRAFRELPNECAVCKWSEYPEVLEVNHKDLNRSNEAIENLEILCPTHHQVFHYLDGSGRWANRRQDD
jgi:hypothetical protein